MGPHWGNLTSWERGRPGRPGCSIRQGPRSQYRGTGGTPAVVRPRVGLVGGVEVPSRHALSGL